MGPMSGGLTDIDLDCLEAIILAPAFLPETEAIYGRPSKPRSHRFYITDDPEPRAWRQWKDDKQKMLLELRMGGGGKGAQSVLPGSVHTSGEIYAWDVDGEPAKSTCAELKAACIKLAVAALLIRHWPRKGALHDTALGVGGFLARAGWTADEIEHFVFSICSVAAPRAGAEEARQDRARQRRALCGGRTGARHADDDRDFGEAVARTVAKILDYKSRGGARTRRRTAAR